MKTYLRHTVLIVTMLLFHQTPSGASDFNKVSTTGFVFLQLPVSARYAALGETGITLPDVASEGMFINPALIALSGDKISFNATYASWYVETSHQAAGLTYRIPQIGTVGLQFIYFDFGEIQRTRNPLPTETGSYVDLGTYDAGGLAIGLSYARQLTARFAFGATLKYIREFIFEYNATNVIIDMGFLYDTQFSGVGLNNLRLGVFLNNFGLDAKYVEQKFKMPQQMKLGLSAEIFSNREDDTYVTLLTEVVHPNDMDEHIQLGLENQLMRYIVLRGGYKLGYEGENWTAGIGLRFDFKGRKMRFDASYMQHDYLDTTLRYTLAMEL